MELSPSNKSDNLENLDRADKQNTEYTDDFKNYAGPILKMFEKELLKLYVANVKLKQKNKFLKDKLSKFYKRPSLDLEYKMTNFFKRRSLHLPFKSQHNDYNQNNDNYQNNEKNNEKFNDKINDKIIEKDDNIDSHDKSTVSDSLPPVLKSSYSLKLPMKSKSFAHRLKFENKSQHSFILNSYSILHNDIIRHISTDQFPNDNALIFSCSSDSICKISLLDEHDNIDTILVYSGHNFPVNSLSCNFKTPGLICSACGDGSVHLWSFRSIYDFMIGDEDDKTITSEHCPDLNSKAIQNLSVPLININAHKAPISSVEWNPNGVNFISASWDHLISIWDSNNQTCIQQLRGHNNEVTIAKHGNNDHTIFSGSVDRTVRIWDTRTSNSSVNICHAHENVVTTVEPFHKNDFYILSSGKDKILRIWDQRNLSQYVYSSKFGSPLNRVSLSNNDLLICVPEDNGHIWICNSKLQRYCQITSPFKKRQRTGMNCSSWIDHSSNLSNSQNLPNKNQIGFLTADNMGYLYHWKTKIPNKSKTD